ncbi:RNB domain-containing ribonuclease [Solicola sp. PLA-1-18]|uniref:RNB domain-containing ribonuclease n=1 Tax=Solicola sp. PLA-1-18 TaxID=3380532 RepID=UPI003B81672D
MPRRPLIVAPESAAAVAAQLDALESELGVGAEFADDVLAEAAESAASPSLPERDLTDLPFVTIDPPGARDLDQAMHLERLDDGYRVHYAIADVGAFVRPGGLVDAEAHRRGQTLYGPSRRIPLHPPQLSEDAASLLADQVRPALVWQVELSESGEGRSAEVFRALVRSRAQHDYAGVQKAVDDGTAEPVFTLLREIGELRKRYEQVRGGVSLPLPDQEIVADDGHLRVEYRANLPVEGWNEQISLLVGMAAAHLMLYAQVGLLRTLPPADPRAVSRLHRTADALGIAWPAEMAYPEFVRTLDPDEPRDVAMLDACTTLLRGAGYVAFVDAVPEQPEHAAIASEYAHATAPLRRLADRYVGETCVAICAGTPVPAWVRDALDALPATMQASERLAHTYEREVVDLVEAGMLAGSVGQEFDAVVLDADAKHPTRGTAMVVDPAVEAQVEADHELPVGSRVRVRLTEADVDARRVRFRLV